MTASVLFYAYAAVAIVGAVGLVTTSRLVHAVMFLFATLFSIAALYLLLGSEFLAAMQLFVYGGAITVLVLFVLMLTRPAPEPDNLGNRAMRLVAAGVTAIFFLVLSVTMAFSRFTLASSKLHDTASLAEILFSRYVLPFEIAGLVLTIALIGAIVLAREDDVRQDVEQPASQEPALASGTLAEGADA